MVELKVTKSADKSYVFFGVSNKIKYSVIITNVGDVKATCVKLKDIISKGAYFIPGTFAINGCCQDVFKLDNDISVGAIQPGSNILVTFDVEVAPYNPATEIINQAVVTYCGGDGTVKTAYSPQLIIPVIKINMCIKKTVDKYIANVGEILNYSVLIRNDSNINIDNIVFFDSLSTSVELLPASVLINLEPQYIESFNEGVPLGSLNAYSSTIISFQVKIILMPELSTIKNTGRIEFSYTISDNGIPVTSFGDSCSNQVITKVNSSSWTC